MACGLPVIASANAGASELIRDGETGFILRDPQDHLQLASLIRRIQAESGLRLSMGAAASHYLMTNYSWDDNAERTRELLECILTSSRI
jgi:glycosyltransferase involved in cell wall biosynthesis